MWLDELLAAQKRGEARGMVSICSAHPWVLQAAMRQVGDGFLLVESTCNQVNQFGGYTGLTPAEFAARLRGRMVSNGLPPERLILGGDHLGPYVWQNEPADAAMEKAVELVRAYARAGYTKIHLDASMKLAGDPPGPLAEALAAQRAALMAKAAEQACAEVGGAPPRYVIGTEVPVPGGAKEHEQGLAVTSVAAVQQTVEATRAAFQRAGLDAAWERVIAVVVQPGVEFGDDFVLDYRPANARELAKWVETQPGLVYEAHSTDYQTRASLRALVQDHFALLKVGPGLTFAFREAAFALEAMEVELVPPESCSKLTATLEAAMLRNPEYWQKYYHGDLRAQALARKYSLSDRLRYYWGVPEVQRALEKLLANLDSIRLPLPLISQYAPRQAERIRSGEISGTPAAILLDQVQAVLSDYRFACGDL